MHGWWYDQEVKKEGVGKCYSSIMDTRKVSFL